MRIISLTTFQNQKLNQNHQKEAMSMRVSAIRPALCGEKSKHFVNISLHWLSPQATVTLLPPIGGVGRRRR